MNRASAGGVALCQSRAWADRQGNAPPGAASPERIRFVVQFMSNTAEPAPTGADEAALVERLARARAELLSEMHKIVVGQDEVLEQLIYAVFCRGHCLLEGVPGLAKTVMVQTLAAALNLTFRRIQFTPDLMPSDITGTDIIQ